MANLILQVIQARQGKYLVCFPSYRYLESVKNLIDAQAPETTIIAQTPEMDDAARQEFLSRFTDAEHDGGLLGFAIMGGLFGEGIDLPGAQLIGVIVVSVGLPQICVERELIKEYYDDQQWPGFAFCLPIPRHEPRPAKPPGVSSVMPPTAGSSSSSMNASPSTATANCSPPTGTTPSSLGPISSPRPSPDFGEFRFLRKRND